MLEALSSLIIRVKMASHEVQASTTVMLTVLAQLVQASKAQLQEIAEATVEVGQMATSSRQVANRTHQLYDVVHEAQSASQRGRLSVQQAVAGMRRIYENVHETSLKVQALDKHSSDINNVIAVISNIAQEMNYLAQDAVKQASQVGEHGKGFAVVASDIQRLAEQTTRQVSSIAQIVQGVHEDINSATLSMQDTEQKSSAGAKLAQEAGGSLETIFAVVEHQAQEMDVINQMTKQQLQSFTAIESIMYSISQSTQQISISTSTGSHHLEYLAGQVEQLRHSVEAFKLPQTPPVLDAPTNPFMPVPSASSQQQFPRLPSTMPLPDGNVGWAVSEGNNASIS
jgi:methyl-accepting chemotaxis protein